MGHRVVSAQQYPRIPLIARQLRSRRSPGPGLRALVAGASNPPASAKHRGIGAGAPLSEVVRKLLWLNHLCCSFRLCYFTIAILLHKLKFATVLSKAAASASFPLKAALAWVGLPVVAFCRILRLA